MKPLSSPHTIAIAAASAAALATATTAAYHLCRSPRHENPHKLCECEKRPQSPFRPHQNSLGDVLALCNPRNTEPHACQNTTHTLTAQRSEGRDFCPTPKPASSLIHTRLTVFTKKPRPTNASFQWAVFWDIENVPIPRASTASHFVRALRKTLAAYRNRINPDTILRIHAIANIRRTSVRLRQQLQANGVNLTHVESKGRKDVADKALITEICLTTREYPTPFGICVISGDGDFSYAVSRLTALGYDTVVVAPTRQSFSTLLATVPDAVIPLSTVLEACHEPSFETQSSLREKSAMRVTNPRKQNQKAQMVKQTTNAMHPSKRAATDVAKTKQRGGAMLPNAGRDENDASRKSTPSHSQDNKADSKVLPHYFDKSCIGKHGAIPAPPAQVTKTPNKQDKIQSEASSKRKRANQALEIARDESLLSQDIHLSRATKKTSTHVTLRKGVDTTSQKVDHGGTEGDNGKVPKAVVKLKKKDAVPRKPDKGKLDSAHQIAQKVKAGQTDSLNESCTENNKSRKQYHVIPKVKADRHVSLNQLCEENNGSGKRRTTKKAATQVNFGKGVDTSSQEVNHGGVQGDNRKTPKLPVKVETKDVVPRKLDKRKLDSVRRTARKVRSDYKGSLNQSCTENTGSRTQQTPTMESPATSRVSARTESRRVFSFILALLVIRLFVFVYSFLVNSLARAVVPRGMLPE